MRATRLPDPLPENPLPLAAEWLDAAQTRPVGRNPNAMALASVGPDGRPAVRIVLCKGLVAAQGYLLFYTNYRSRKAAELDHDPRAAALMYWDELGRQLRLEGLVSRSPAEESDAYFASRPWQSRISAWASDQSRPIASLADLDAQLEAAARRFGAQVRDGSLTDTDRPPAPIPRPPHWGGFRLWIDTVECWLEGHARLHERVCWQRRLSPAVDGHGYSGGAWHVTRLQP